MSSLEAINGCKLKIDILQNIIKDYTHLANSGRTVILCCIPSHVNICGNERADTAAKSALSLPITKMKILACELIHYVSKFCLDEWQDIWDCCEGNKLHSIYPTVGIVKHRKNMSSYDSVLHNRLQTSNWSFSSQSLILIEWWWSPNLSILWNSTYSKTHINGMYQLVGHSWKILHGVFCHTLV